MLQGYSMSYMHVPTCFYGSFYEAASVSRTNLTNYLELRGNVYASVETPSLISITTRFHRCENLLSNHAEGHQKIQ